MVVPGPLCSDLGLMLHSAAGSSRLGLAQFCHLHVHHTPALHGVPFTQDDSPICIKKLARCENRQIQPLKQFGFVIADFGIQVSGDASKHRN